MVICYLCRGRGWMPDGQPEDGRMTGREKCWVCRGAGKTDVAVLDAHIAELQALKGPR